MADLLPLSLANYVNCSVKIYTSKPDNQKIIIEPTLKSNEDKNILKLAYISIPNILEHYDWCVLVDVSIDEQQQFVATRVPTESVYSSTHFASETPKAATFVSPIIIKNIFRKSKASAYQCKKTLESDYGWVEPICITVRKRSSNENGQELWLY